MTEPTVASRSFAKAPEDVPLNRRSIVNRYIATSISVFHDIARCLHSGSSLHGHLSMCYITPTLILICNYINHFIAKFSITVMHARTLNHASLLSSSFSSSSSSSSSMSLQPPGVDLGPLYNTPPSLSIPCSVSPFVYSHLSPVRGHVIQPSHFWSSSSSCCIQFSVQHLFRNCGVLHSFYMTKPSYSLAFYEPDNVLPLNYSF